MTNEELVLSYQQGDKQALESLIKNIRGLVVKIANRFYDSGRIYDLDDLIQAGNIGVIEAAKNYKFDMEHKASFSTYAFSVIRSNILDCISGKSLKEKKNTKFYKSMASLNSPLKNGEERELFEIIDSHDDSIENIEHKLYLDKLREDLEKVMKENTTVKETNILKFHYGWDCKRCTFVEIGDILEISDSTVQKIEDTALKKIRSCKWVIDEYKKYYVFAKQNYRTVEEKLDFMSKYFKGVL
ncbi:sigma-70 family RNA polymerase sigma factor [Clostridium chromiireducens]|uniref:Sigma-70 family RNA polymerase sigma factor n=1 Tax=Clostridium chromiireducens TaxID=225345 RepID=A0A964W398_9CLOT|nr:sigma-70 family RNA polymerase sigma factor [Clostridium chromiireducens]MVX64928.1 sigma-70 family RNA polymerase sigma factor [Clostridium chromiireducens]